jgi:hypothetical protein
MRASLLLFALAALHCDASSHSEAPGTGEFPLVLARKKSSSFLSSVESQERLL